MTNIPKTARVIIIGGGVIGCSVAYHLAKKGWKEIILLERKQLTSGTTWHAAGLIAQLRASANMTKLAKYSQELYGNLEKETGVSTGFKRCGSITVALTEERFKSVKGSIWAHCAMLLIRVEEVPSPQSLGKSNCVSTATPLLCFKNEVLCILAVCKIVQSVLAILDVLLLLRVVRSICVSNQMFPV